MSQSLLGSVCCAGALELHLGLYFLSSKVSSAQAGSKGQGKSLGPCQALPKHAYSLGHTHSLTYVLPRIFYTFSKPPMDISFHSFFFYAFWLVCCLPQLLLASKAAMLLNSCCWLFLTNDSGENTVCTWQVLS